MIGGLLRLVLVLLVIVAAAAFFFGYQWGEPDTAGPEPVGTVGPIDPDVARERAGEIGEKTAEAAGAVTAAAQAASLTGKIKAKMALDDLVSAADIDVDNSNGVITLSGIVNSAKERERAVELARETDGVVRVVDNLAVR